MKNFALLIALCTLPTLLWGRSDGMPRDTVSWAALVDRYEDVLGHTYRAGGQNPGGFDCSGLQKHLFRAYGYTMPASSSSYANWGTPITRDSIRVGDFLLFEGRGSGSIGHVGLCVGIQDGKILMLHSATHSGVLIENWVGQPYYERRYVGARRGIPFRFDPTPAQPSSDSAPEASAASSL
ncbi:MAG: NlpC/P60 family protein [Cryomorphaceae bacterium]|jgi:cell wall-associated NlpC family hydrolase|nr:NlpC/P60 family protein [Cryomorphaceae bacterium]